MRPALAERFDQRHSFDATSASLAQTGFVETNDDRWPMIFLGEPRRDNAEHARLPAARPDDNRSIARRIAIWSYLFVGRREDLFFDRLPFAVLRVELRRQLRRFVFVFR